MTDLGGRRVLVTGATSGIGAATARACAAAGARVAALARRADRLAALADDTGCVALSADVRDVARAQAAVDEAAEALGGLDAVVNNAGVAFPDTVAGGNPEEWRAMLEVNVLGLLGVTQAAIPHLRSAGRGDVVLVSSMSGRRVPGAYSAVYSGTKHAVHAIGQALRRELHPDGVRVVVISPGFVLTELQDRITAPEQRERMLQLRDAGSLDPEVVARHITAALSEPPEVNVYEIAIVATAQET